MKKVVIARYINDISINGVEFLLDDDNEIIKFDSESEAMKFLSSNGVKPESVLLGNIKDGAFSPL